MFDLLISASAAGDAKDAGAAAFPPFDPWHFPSQLFWLAVLFGGLYIVLSRFILPQLGSVLERRQNTIANDLDEAARMNDQALEAQKAVETSIAEARAKARETAAKARAKIDAEIREETSKVDADLDAKLEAAEARIAKMRSDAMTNVEGIAAEAAKAMVAKFDSSIKKGDVDKTVSAVLSGDSK